MELLILTAIFVGLGLILAIAATRGKKSRLQQERNKARADAQALFAQNIELRVQVSDLKKEIEKAHFLAKQAALTRSKDIKAARADAVRRAHAVAHGFEGENFAPLIQDRWDIKDFRHMGDPVDYLVFANADKVRTSKAGPQVEEVVLLDIKTGKSSLNTIQRRIRDAVTAGRVRFAVYNPDTKKLKCWPPDPNPKQLELPFE